MDESAHRLVARAIGRRADSSTVGGVRGGRPSSARAQRGHGEDGGGGDEQHERHRRGARTHPVPLGRRVVRRVADGFRRGGCGRRGRAGFRPRLRRVRRRGCRDLHLRRRGPHRRGAWRGGLRFRRCGRGRCGRGRCGRRRCGRRRPRGRRFRRRGGRRRRRRRRAGRRRWGRTGRRWGWRPVAAPAHDGHGAAPARGGEHVPPADRGHGTAVAGRGDHAGAPAGRAEAHRRPRLARGGDHGRAARPGRDVRAGVRGGRARRGARERPHQRHHAQQP